MLFITLTDHRITVQYNHAHNYQNAYWYHTLVNISHSIKISK